MFKLVLSNKGFPERFNNHNNLPNYDVTLSKKENAEKLVINSFNRYNPKLEISRIEYENLEDVYGEKVSEFISSGLIVEETNIMETPDNRDHYLNDGYVINYNNGGTFEKVSAYVYVGKPQEDSRNIFIAQTIFPSLIDQMKLYLDSPSYTMTNKPVYFVNLVNKNYKDANGYISRHINYWQNAGIHVIDITGNIEYEYNNNLENILSANLKSDYDPNHGTYKYYNPTTNIYHYYTENKNLETYTVDVTNKLLTLKKEAIEDAVRLDSNGKHNFRGSNEKFYWAECIPLVIIASRQNYNIDISEYRDFINTYRPHFRGRNTDKFERSELILNFFEKII